MYNPNICIVTMGNVIVCNNDIGGFYQNNEMDRDLNKAPQSINTYQFWRINKQIRRKRDFYAAFNGKSEIMIKITMCYRNRFDISPSLRSPGKQTINNTIKSVE